jgi:hypothetical protein
VNKDSTVSITDLLTVKKYVLNISSIIQNWQINFGWNRLQIKM